MKVIDKPLNKVANDFHDVDYSEVKFPTVVVTKNPTDFPNKYVARLFYLSMPTNIIMVKESLEEIRAGIPEYFERFTPTVYDDPVIVEYYI